MTVKEFKETKLELNFNTFRERLASTLKQITRARVEAELSIIQAWLQSKKKPKRLYPIYKLLQLTHVDLYWLFGVEQRIDCIELIDASRVKIKVVTGKKYKRIFARAFETWRKLIYNESQFKQLVAKRLREYITKSNYLEIAKLLEVSPKTITDYWLKGRNLPTIDKLFKIAEYFNVSIYTFLPVSGFVIYRLEQGNQLSKTKTKFKESITKQINIDKLVRQRTVEESKTKKTNRVNMDTRKTNGLIVNVEQDIHCSLTKEDLDAIAKQIAKYYTTRNNNSENILQRFSRWLKRLFGKEV